MTRLLYLCRFFIVVPPMPLLMLAAFVVATTVAVAIVLVDPSRASGALTPLLLLQLFGAASGFDVPARRGHYDLLLTHGVGRRWVIVGHWLASIAPGLIGWFAVALALHAVKRPDDVSLFGSGTIVAVALVSTIPWATTVRLPRFSGAIGWLLILATASLLLPSGWSVELPGPADPRQSAVSAAFTVLVYPPALVGRGLTAHDALVVTPALAIAALCVLVAVWSVNRRDIPLEAAQ
jgi:hypothetical protein